MQQAANTQKVCNAGKVKSFRLLMNVELHRKLKETAARVDCTMNEFLLRALREYIRSER